jgi:hypothetical protein
LPSWSYQLKHAGRVRQLVRRFVFTGVDELMFALAIRGIFPSVVFLDGQRMVGPDDVHTEWPGITSDSVVIVNPATMPWRPRFEPGAARLTWMEICNLPAQSTVFFRSRWDWGMSGWQPRPHQLGFELPTLLEGDIGRRYDPDDSSSEQFILYMRQIFRIVSRLGTNRFKIGTPRSNEIEHGTDALRTRDAKRHNLWLGHHALEWCRRNPRRMLDGCYRPCDDWEPPNSEWYQSLRRQVELKYGLGIGEPPPRPAELREPSAAYLGFRVV